MQQLGKRKMSRPGPDPEVTDVEIKDAIKQRDQPFATTKSIANMVGLSTTRASQRLDRLAEQGEIKKGQVGKKSKIYWIEE